MYYKKESSTFNTFFLSSSEAPNNKLLNCLILDSFGDTKMTEKKLHVSYINSIVVDWKEKKYNLFLNLSLYFDSFRLWHFILQLH